MTPEKDQLEELQNVLGGKKASLRQIYKTQAEANTKVWVLSESTEKAMTRLAKILERYEDVGPDMVDVAPKVEEKAEFIDETMGMVKKAAREADDATQR